MLKYVFAVIFIALAWAAVLVFELPTWIAWTATAVIAGGLVLWAVGRWLLARRAARKIESALAGGADQDGLRPEVRAQIQAMQAEFNRALHMLKSSRAGRGGSGALAKLPWYVIIGPPGSGKSTLLRNSGLRFPYLSAKKGAVRGVGGTRNCDWWMANEGILLDTAGRWSTEEDDQDEWLAFLDQLRRSRRGRPLNGVLLAISAADLLGQGAEDVASLAKKLRDRVDEVMGRLEVSLPVYLLVTKCDLIGGFVETFGGLKDKERGQIWGVTLPLDATAGMRPELFVEKLDRLVDVLELQSLPRIAGEPRQDLRRRLFEFPQQFEELCPGLVELVNDLFAENAYQDSPILRGVYFTSGTQEGRPIDRIVKRIAEAIGVAPLIESQPIVKAKSYFLRDVFNQVIFPDQNVAGQGERAVRRQKLVAVGGAAALFAAAAGIALMPVSAYSRNLALASLIEKYATGLAASRGAAGGEPVPSAELDDLRDSGKRLLDLQAKGPEVAMTFGFFQGDKLARAVGTVVRDHVATPVLFRDLEIMNLYAARPNRGYDDALDALRLHKLLSVPKAAGEPRPEGSDDAWAEAIAGTRQLAVERWRQHVRDQRQNPSARSEQVIGDAVEMYLRQATKDPALWEPRNREASDKVRKALCDAVQRDPLEQIVGDPAFEKHALSLNDLVGGSSTLFQDYASVPGAFTRSGWALVKRKLEARSRGRGNQENPGDWALEGCEEFSPEKVAELRRRYVERYETEWRNFLSKVYPKGPQNLSQAKDILDRHVQAQPLAEIWRALAENVPLEPPPAAVAGPNVKPKGLKDRVIGAIRSRAANAGSGEDEPDADLLKVDRAFAPFQAFAASAKEGVPSLLDTYFGQLGKLAEAIKKYEGTQDAKALREETDRVHDELDTLVKRAPAGWDLVLRKMLLPPATGMKVTTGGVEAGELNRSWCDGVVVHFDQTLGDRFPFNPAGLDAPLDAVEKFFHPQNGALWLYVSTALKDDFEPRSFRPRPGGGARYRTALSDYLRRAHRATDLLFHRGASQLSVPIQVRIWPGSSSVTQISFRMGAERALHINAGERFLPLLWPAPEAELAVLSNRSLKIGKSGDWALWRLLGQARSTRIGQDAEEYLQTTIEVPPETIRLDFKPAGLLRDLKDLTPPRAVSSAPTPCAR